jgi:hypothetical protein
MAATSPPPTLRTPNNIEVLLHYYYSPDPHPQHTALAVEEAITVLLGYGCLQPENTPRVYKVTPLGAAWIQLLCATPIPRVAYVDAAGKVIDDGYAEAR